MQTDVGASGRGVIDKCFKNVPQAEQSELALDEVGRKQGGQSITSAANPILFIDGQVYTRRVVTKSPLISVGVRNLPYWQPPHRRVISQLTRVSTMEAESQRPKRRGDTISALNEAIEALNPLKISSFPPAKAVFGSATVLLTLIRVRFLLSCHGLLHVHTQLGVGGESTGSCRAWVVLRRRLPSARPRDEWEETRRSRSVRV